MAVPKDDQVTCLKLVDWDTLSITLVKNYNWVQNYKTITHYIYKKNYQKGRIICSWINCWTAEPPRIRSRNLNCNPSVVDNFTGRVVSRHYLIFKLFARKAPSEDSSYRKLNANSPPGTGSTGSHFRPHHHTSLAKYLYGPMWSRAVTNIVYFNVNDLLWNS